MFAGLDLASGQLFYRFRDRKRWQEFLDFLRQLRTRFPVGRLYIVCDNFSPHRKAEVATWCADHDVELVFTPSNASWLNRIECEFTALRSPEGASTWASCRRVVADGPPDVKMDRPVSAY